MRADISRIRNRGQLRRPVMMLAIIGVILLGLIIVFGLPGLLRIKRWFHTNEAPTEIKP